MNTIVREASVDDLKTIVAFQTLMAKETEDLMLDNYTLNKGVEAVLLDSGRAKYFIAETNGVPSGMLMITYEWSDWRNGWVWWIQSVFTDPGFRKQGIYRLLYNHIKSIVLSTESIKGIRLYVDKRNNPAQKVYENLGMNGNHYSTFEWMKES